MTAKEIAPLFTWRSAICESDLHPTTRFVAFALSFWMNERGSSAFPGATRLAHDTGLDDDTVRKHLHRLVETGWLRLIERGGTQGQRRRANRYEASVPPSQTEGYKLGHPPVSEPLTLGLPESSSPVSSSIPSTRRKTPRARNELFDAIASACGMDLNTLTERGAKVVGIAASELATVGATPRDVAIRAARYKTTWPNIKLTPIGLSKHWAELVPPPRASNQPKEWKKEEWLK